MCRNSSKAANHVVVEQHQLKSYTLISGKDNQQHMLRTEMTLFALRIVKKDLVPTGSTLSRKIWLSLFKLPSAE